MGFYCCLTGFNPYDQANSCTKSRNKRIHVMYFVCLCVRLNCNLNKAHRFWDAAAEVVLDSHQVYGKRSARCKLNFPIHFFFFFCFSFFKFAFGFAYILSFACCYWWVRVKDRTRKRFKLSGMTTTRLNVRVLCRKSKDSIGKLNTVVQILFV